MPEKHVTERDSRDFRDRIYQPALLPLPDELWPRKKNIHLRDQSQEGSCTGFGLAAVIDYLNSEEEIRTPVSARMLYEMAKRHDRWPGQSYSGSSARGAMKGWHKNGVCPEADWEYESDRSTWLTRARQEAALRFPLGAYYRIMPKRSDMHAALNEVHAVFATAAVHRGWDPDRVQDGRIPYESRWKRDSGHAFAIVGYTKEGFIVQNSWGESWGGLKHGRTTYPGLAIWKYEDFDANVWDAWVARRALPLESLGALAGGRLQAGNAGTELAESSPSQLEIRDHYVHIDDGRFDRDGNYPSSEEGLRETLRDALQASGRARPQHIVIYAHGGLNKIKSCACRVRAWREVFAANRIHEIHVIWETGLWAELKDIILGKEEQARRRAGGFSDWWDKVVEKTTGWAGRALWREMQDDAKAAFAKPGRRRDPGGAGARLLRVLCEELSAPGATPRPQIHLVGHSAGSIFFAHLLARQETDPELCPGLTFDNLVLFAPACTAELYNSKIYPALVDRRVERLAHYHLDDDTEQDDDVGSIYRKSLLYLVSRSYQQKGEVVPIMGMAKYLKKLKTAGVESRIVNRNPEDHPTETRSKSHGGFDNDLATMTGMLATVLGHAPRRRFKAGDMEGY